MQLGSTLVIFVKCREALAADALAVDVGSQCSFINISNYMTLNEFNKNKFSFYDYIIIIIIIITSKTRRLELAGLRQIIELT